MATPQKDAKEQVTAYIQEQRYEVRGTKWGMMNKFRWKRRLVSEQSLLEKDRQRGFKHDRLTYWKDKKVSLQVKEG